ncbi:carboxymuconolactone decarboxylase family protein [Pseudomonas sp. Gutcm_11s]|uniref:carboxymuconolactone decarboxylase family protein n=1 Tax=Pseudomonas sp. Gutcm_11s TaxID=3026088 RepID=UPI0023610855|nr:carboxymuconolactone decarboxylase family protein [Pseudomonas sp. Gutcm_11s]MDD0844145.1 carboxymuconolactone decarboxylase family protein [Pseudomonas sp. Gutcm_11s]
MTSKRNNYHQTAPHVFKAIYALEQAQAAFGLESSLRELIKVRASQLNGCALCVDLHSNDALQQGESARRLMALGVWEEAPFFSERERAALLWTDTLTLLAERHAPDAVYAEVARHFDESEIAELTLAIATINAWNRFGVGFALQPLQ